MEIQEICQNIQSQNKAMKAILTRIHELCDKAGNEGMSDADYREVDELRHFVRKHCRIPVIHQIDLILENHSRLLSEIGADSESGFIGSKIFAESTKRPTDAEAWGQS